MYIYESYDSDSGWNVLSVPNTELLLYYRDYADTFSIAHTIFCIKTHSICKRTHTLYIDYKSSVSI